MYGYKSPCSGRTIYLEYIKEEQEWTGGVTVSSVTDIQSSDGGTTVDNTALTIETATGSDADTLLAVISSTDGSTQTYEITDSTGSNSRTGTDSLVDGDLFVVTAEDGVSTESYAISLV